jgi:hypothetical protein
MQLFRGRSVNLLLVTRNKSEMSHYNTEGANGWICRCDEAQNSQVGKSTKFVKYLTARLFTAIEERREKRMTVSRETKKAPAGYFTSRRSIETKISLECPNDGDYESKESLEFHKYQ